MNIGMLWFDNDQKADISVKIERAATYYQNKYGKLPNLCYIHPSMVANKRQINPGAENATPSVIRAGNVEVRLTKSVLPNHFWIGINTSNGNGHVNQ